MLTPTVIVTLHGGRRPPIGESLQKCHFCNFGDGLLGATAQQEKRLDDSPGDFQRLKFSS